MNRPEPNKRESYWLGRYTWFMLILWTAIVGALFLFNFMSFRKEFSALPRLEAIAGFNKDVVYRRWRQSMEVFTCRLRKKPRPIHT